MTDFKAIILCNSPIAIPGIKEFLFFGKVSALVTTEQNTEMQYLLQQLTTGTGVPVLTVHKKNATAIITEAIQKNEVTVGLLMTFPFILPKTLLDLPARGFINFHYGLLPQYRGPQPILWQLLNNEPEAGLAVHKVDEGVDTGPIVWQEKIPIAATDTYGILQGKLSFLGAKAAATLFKILSYGSMIPAAPQDETKAAYYKNPVAKDLTINWKEMSADKIIRTINACNPWNKAAGTSIKNWTIGITEAEISTVTDVVMSEVPGTILAISPEKGLLVQAMDKQIVKINIVYLPEGWISGWRLAHFAVATGDVFE